MVPRYTARVTLSRLSTASAAFKVIAIISLCQLLFTPVVIASNCASEAGLYAGGGAGYAAVDAAVDSSKIVYSIGSGYRGNGTFYSNDPSGRIRVTAPSGSTSYLPGGGTAFTAPTSIAFAPFLNVSTVYVAATAVVGGLPSLFTISVPSQAVSLITALPEPVRWMDVTSNGSTVYFVGVNSSRLYAVDMPLPSMQSNCSRQAAVYSGAGYAGA